MNDDGEQQIKAVQESVRRFSPLLVSFLVAGTFLAITALTTDHEMLLRGRSVRLPLVDASVPIKGFFWVAPILWVLQHAALLMQLMLVMRQVRGLRPGSSLREKLVAELPVSAAGELILRDKRPGPMNVAVVLLFYAACCAFPLAVLCVLQGQFVAYHSWPITCSQAVLVLLDLAFILFAVPRILGGPGQHYWTWRPGWRFWRWRSLRRLLSLGLMVLVVCFTLGLAAISVTFSVSGASVAALIPRWRWPKLFLELRGRDLQRSPDERRLVLNDRNLYGADLRGAVLGAADLGGSDLTAALLDNANATEATFSPYSVVGAMRSSAKKTATLEGSSLAGAMLRHANLTRVSLEGASLVGTKLEGAQLDDADLDGTDLTNAVALNASLAGAHLDRAILDRADLRGADLSHARGRGLRAVGGDATCADLRGADLAASAFIDVRLDAIDFSGADIEGADFRYSTLRRTLGLNAVANDLRWADLGGSCLGERAVQERGTLVLAGRGERILGSDFRDALLGQLTDEAKGEIEKASSAVEPDRRDRCEKLLDASWAQGDACLDPGRGELDLAPAAPWTGIARYYDRLREFFAERICRQPGFGDGLLARFFRAGEVSNPEVDDAAATALLATQLKGPEECPDFRRLTGQEIRTLQVAAGCLLTFLPGSAEPHPSACDLRLSDSSPTP